MNSFAKAWYAGSWSRGEGPFLACIAPRRTDAGSNVSTPKGLSVRALTAAISSTSSSVCMVDAPSVPMPPAAETAATSWWYETPPIPASMTGCSISRSSVSRVCMPGTLRRPARATPLRRRRQDGAGGGGASAAA